jgi:rubrerythrin
MSPFERVREGLRAVGLTRGGTEDYVCRSCGYDFEVEHHVCPECGGYSVERLDW